MSNSELLPEGVWRFGLTFKKYLIVSCTSTCYCICDEHDFNRRRSCGNNLCRDIYRQIWRTHHYGKIWADTVVSSTSDVGFYFLRGTYSFNFDLLDDSGNPNCFQYFFDAIGNVGDVYDFSSTMTVSLVGPGDYSHTYQFDIFAWSGTIGRYSVYCRKYKLTTSILSS